MKDLQLLTTLQSFKPVLVRHEHMYAAGTGNAAQARAMLLFDGVVVLKPQATIFVHLHGPFWTCRQSPCCVQGAWSLRAASRGASSRACCSCPLGPPGTCCRGSDANASPPASASCIHMGHQPHWESSAASGAARAAAQSHKQRAELIWGANCVLTVLQHAHVLVDTYAHF